MPVSGSPSTTIRPALASARSATLGFSAAVYLSLAELASSFPCESTKKEATNPRSLVHDCQLLDHQADFHVMIVIEQRAVVLDAVGHPHPHRGVMPRPCSITYCRATPTALSSAVFTRAENQDSIPRLRCDRCEDGDKGSRARPRWRLNIATSRTCSFCARAPGAALAP